MKILFINDMYTVGGATKALVELILQLKKNGHEPIVCTSVRDEFNTFMDSHGIQNIADGHISVMDVIPNTARNERLWFQRRQWWYVKARYKAMKIIENSIDMKTINLIHTNSIRNDVGCMLYKKYKIPHIMHVREFGQEDFSCSVYMPHYYNYLNHRCSILLAVSNAVRKSVISKGISAEKIQTLYDGVNFSNFTVNNNNNLDNGKLRIVIVGGICATKGQHIAVKAINLLPKQIRENVTLDMIGWDDPVYMSKIYKMIGSLELENQVRILGSKDSVADLLHSYNIGLMCSKSEGFGRVTAEYMYSGLGVIAADTGASPELVKNGFSGLIYHRDDPRDLANKIEMMYCNPGMLKTYSRNAHLVSQKYFSCQTNYNKIINVYKKYCHI